MEPLLRRTWAEIDLDALEHNFRTLQDRVGADTGVVGVVKADAYGHGALQTARTLENLGAAYLAGLSVNFWQKDELLAARKIADTYTPQMDEETRKKRRRGWKKAVSRALDWARGDAED